MQTHFNPLFHAWIPLKPHPELILMWTRDSQTISLYSISTHTSAWPSVTVPECWACKSPTSYYWHQTCGLPANVGCVWICKTVNLYILHSSPQPSLNQVNYTTASVLKSSKKKKQPQTKMQHILEQIHQNKCLHAGTCIHSCTEWGTQTDVVCMCASQHVSSINTTTVKITWTIQ